MKRAVLALLGAVWCACGAPPKPGPAAAPAPAGSSSAPQVTRPVDDDAEPPPSGLAASAPFPSIVHRELAGGLALRVVERHTLPLIELVLVVRAGRASDLAKTGVSALAAELLKAGGAGSWSARQLVERAEGLGARLAVETELDATRLSIAVTKDHLDAALELLAAVAQKPRFDRTEFVKLRQREIERVTSQSHGDSDWTARMALFRELYELPSATHPYSRPDATAAELKQIELADCRAWHAAHVTPGNAFLVITGNVTPGASAAAAQRAFAGWTGERQPRASFPTPQPPNRTSVHVVDRPGSSQSRIYLATFGPELRDPRFPAFVLLSQVLGGGASGRLFLDVREQRSLAYATSSRVEEVAEGPLPLVLGATTRAESTGRATAALIEHLDRLGSSPPTEPESAAAARFLADTVTTSASTVGALAGMTARLGVFGLPDDWYDDFRSEVAAVDPARAGQLAARYFKKERALIVVAGDAARVAEPLRRFGPVTVLDAGRDFAVRRTLTHDPSVPLDPP